MHPLLCTCSSVHILRHSWQPPPAFCVHVIACLNRCFTLVQLGEPQLGSLHVVACTSSSIVR